MNQIFSIKSSIEHNFINLKHVCISKYVKKINNKGLFFFVLLTYHFDLIDIYRVVMDIKKTLEVEGRVLSVNPL